MAERSRPRVSVPRLSFGLLAFWLLCGILGSPRRPGLYLVPLVLCGLLWSQLRNPARLRSRWLAGGLVTLLAAACYQLGSVWRVALPLGPNLGAELAPAQLGLIVAVPFFLFSGATTRLARPLGPPGRPGLAPLALLVPLAVLLLIATAVLRPTYFIDPLPILAGLVARSAELMLLILLGAISSQALSAPAADAAGRSVRSVRAPAIPAGRRG